MKKIINYLREYFYDIHKGILLVTSLFTAVLIFLNYYYNIDDSISSHPIFINPFISRYCIYLIAFAVPYLFYYLVAKRKYIFQPIFLLLILIAPAIFAIKATLPISLHLSDNIDQNNYWNHLIYWPILFIITLLLIFFIWKAIDNNQPFYGIKTKGIDWKPYWLMLLIMVPLITAASTQADFLAMYPKLKIITDDNSGNWITFWHKLLYEISYGSDFISIELFFRGFLILAFIKWAGKDAILPMACFYCSIHFGKPLGECISSYFGGIILGVVVYNTRSILGGLIVHLGIAWMMEIGGYIGNEFF